MSEKQTCETVIDGYLAGRFETIRALQKATAVCDPSDIEALSDAEIAETETDYTREELIESQRARNDLVDETYNRLHEMPLCVETYKLVKVTLGTGGPGDWFEARIDSDGEIDRIDYHYNDWFDHAERRLEGADYDTAERFIREVAGLE